MGNGELQRDDIYWRSLRGSILNEIKVEKYQYITIIVYNVALEAYFASFFIIRG